MRIFHLAYELFFQRSGGHPDLHSFPTRRSSDLTAARRSRRRAASGSSAASAGAPARDSSRAAATVPRTSQRALIRPPPWQDDPVDRKSTRLNSSHVKISYAVFCLKKKKQVKEQT